MIVGADGANSRVAKAIDAGEYNYAIAFQERIRIDDEKMAFYENLAGTQFTCFNRTKVQILTHLWGPQEMYVGDDVSPDFYGWVFPKYDHVGVGTGTVVNRPAIKEYQDATRKRAGKKIEGGKIIKANLYALCCC
jgi:geranylgeranyl reductase